MYFSEVDKLLINHLDAKYLGSMKKRSTKVFQKGNSKAQIFGRHQAQIGREKDGCVNKAMAQFLLSPLFCCGWFSRWSRLLINVYFCPVFKSTHS